MVGQPQRSPATYRNQKILQERFKGFLVNGAESSAGNSENCTQKYQGRIHIQGRKCRGNTEFQQMVNSFSDTLTNKRNTTYVRKYFNRSLPNISHLTYHELTPWYHLHYPLLQLMIFLSICNISLISTTLPANSPSPLFAREVIKPQQSYLM